MGEATTFPLSILCDSPQRLHPNFFLSRASQVGVPKLAKLGFPWLWSPITLRTDLRWRCGLKQSCSSCRDLFNGMLQALYNQVNQVDSWLFVVKNQIANLTLGPSFGHNLCFSCLNEQCEPILDIYVPRAFQWYKKHHNPLSFHPWNRSLKFWEFIWDSNSHHGSSLGNVRVHSLTLFALLGACDVTPRSPTWPTTLQPWRAPKSRGETHLRVSQNQVAENWDLEARSRLTTLEGVEGSCWESRD